MQTFFKDTSTKRKINTKPLVISIVRRRQSIAGNMQALSLVIRTLSIGYVLIGIYVYRRRGAKAPPKATTNNEPSRSSPIHHLIQPSFNVHHSQTQYGTRKPKTGLARPLDPLSIEL